MVDQNYFARLQMQTLMSDTTIADTRLKLDQIADIYKRRPEQEGWIKAFAMLRKNFPVQALLDADAFAVEINDTPYLLPEELQHDALGFVSGSHMVFSGRFVYPIKDTKGHVAGWCGYDAFGLPKYLDSHNYGYKAKSGLFYGSERLEEYYRSTRTVFVVEGIVCCLWLRSQGFQALASLGSYLTPYMIATLNRFGRRCVVLPDSDLAGTNYRKQVARYLPKALCLQSRIAKDVDDSRVIYPALADEIRKLERPFGRSEVYA